MFPAEEGQELRVRPLRRESGGPWLGHLVSLLVLAGTALWVRSQVGNLPARLPTHLDASLRPDRWVETGSVQMYSALIVGVLIVLMLAALDFGTERSGSAWAARHPEARFSHGPTRTSLISIGLFVAALFSVGTIGQTLQRLGLVLVALPILLAGLLAMLWLSFRRAAPFRQRGALPARLKRIEPSEPGVLLPRASGVGYTINFGHAHWRRALALLLVAPLFVLFVAVVLLG